MKRIIISLCVALSVATATKAQTLYPSVTFNGSTNALVRPTAAQLASANSFALTTGNLSQFASTTSAQLAGVISDETGSGALVFGTSPTLTTPNLGTPSTLTLTNATGLPISTGVSGLGTGVASALAQAPNTASGFVTGGNVTAGFQPLDSELSAIAALTGNGILTRTSPTTAAARTITGTSGQITVTNGDGISGNPTISLPSTISQATTFSAAIPSTNTSSGTVIISGGGGIGVSGAGYFGGQVNVSNNASASVAAVFTNPNSGGYGLLARGGSTIGSTQYIAKFDNYLNSAAFILYSDRADFYGTTEATTAGAGALTVAGGIYSAKKIVANTGLNVGGVSSTTADLIASASATLDFASISAAASADLTLTVTGAATGDSVALGLPSAPTAGIVFQAFVSAANTVTIRATNITAAPIDPASATYRATVISF